MSMHPNTVLMAVLTPDGASHETMLAIAAEYPSEYEDEGGVKIEGREYSAIVMEDDYDEDHQIAGREGDLMFYDHVTCGYGSVITWADLEARKNALAAWAQVVADKYGCTYEIRVTANHW